MEQELKNQMYPNFMIICNKCESKEVIIDNDIGYSDTSGGWGGIHLVCNRCGNKTEIYSHI
ncbi:hypothetical protein NST33_17940 [Paenibacillus sp. FSL L8-0435]|uniref:hypothetical protein n=1 Tax=Paenibacillus sp. FSL L8-0435 TaxID=2954618 RepID=UPI0030D85974